MKLVCVFLLSIFCLATSREINCNGRAFVCYDDRRFYQCVQNGDTRIIMGELQSCPDGLKCLNSADLECDGEFSNEEPALEKRSIFLESLDAKIDDQIPNTLYNEF